MSLVLGSVLAALIVGLKAEAPNMTPMPVVVYAAVFVLVGLGPALVAGIAALELLRRINVGPLTAALAMTAGGAVVGAGWESLMVADRAWGAIAGASIGLMQGLLLYTRNREEPAGA